MLRLFHKYTNNGQTLYDEFDLGNKGLELSITTEQGDPENPTKYTTDYSRSVRLPMTPKNLDIFHFYPELDSVITGGYNGMVVLPIDIVVTDDDNVILESKLKLESIVDYKGNHYIDCTLYGKMNDWFVKMLNTTYWYDAWQNVEVGGFVIKTPVNSNGMKVLDNILDDGYKINAVTIANNWSLENSSLELELQTRIGTYDPTDPYCHSIITWAPTEQGLYNNFENEYVIVANKTLVNTSDGDFWSVATSYNLSATGGCYVPVLGKEASASTPNTAKCSEEPAWIPLGANQLDTTKMIMGDGFTEHEYNQYRSYYQKPCVFINKLFQQYKKISKAYTGLELTLDEDWFNDQNTRYTDVVYTLPDLQRSDKDEEPAAAENTCRFADKIFQDTTHLAGTSGGNHGDITLAVGDFPNHFVNVQSGETAYADLDFNLTLRMHPQWLTYQVGKAGLCEGDGNGSMIDLNIGFYNVNDSNDYSAFNIKIVDENNETWTESSTDYMIKMERVDFEGSSMYKELTYHVTGRVLIGQNYTNSPKGYYMYANYYLQNGPIDNGPGNALMQTRGKLINKNALEQLQITISNVNTKWSKSTDIRSNFLLEMKDLFPKNYCPFSILLQYTKLFNLVWDYDVVKGVTVMTKEKWFSLHKDEIQDWTYKIDRNQNFSFKPLYWNAKTVLLNYKEGEDDWCTKFNDNYGMSYGTKRINTNYSFNNETKELMCSNDNDSITPSVIVSMGRYSIYGACNYIGQQQLPSANDPTIYRETFIANKKDNKSANSWGAFYFRGKLQNWYYPGGTNESYPGPSKRLYLGTDPAYPYKKNWWDISVFATDDTPIQIRLDKFAVDLTVYGINSAYRQVLHKRPVFSTYDINGDYCINMSHPAETYYNPLSPEMKTSKGNVWETAVDVFSDRWYNIIMEQYNEQNKMLTCYVNIDKHMYSELKCNRFVYIGNMLYTVYKIYDYQPGKNSLTKVDLLQVSDLTKYIGKNNQ